jgi:hypothetical protein
LFVAQVLDQLPRLSCFFSFASAAVLQSDVLTTDLNGLLPLLLLPPPLLLPLCCLPAAAAVPQAVHVLNCKEFPLRYMVVVVPDTSPGSRLSFEDIEHTAAVLNVASRHNTILAATRSQTIALLELMK